MILLTGHVILTPEHRERMIALGAEHSARSRGEAGCLGHRCHVDVEQPDRLVFVEEWADIAAVRAHFAVPASAAFVAEMRALSPQPPVIRIFFGRGCVGAGGGIKGSHAKARRREGAKKKEFISHEDTKRAVWSVVACGPVGRVIIWPNEVR